MSVIKQTDQAPETIDAKPLCECPAIKASFELDLKCAKHPDADHPASGRYRSSDGEVAWFCEECVVDPRVWERIS